jgi:hypothetical protein
VKADPFETDPAWMRRLLAQCESPIEKDFLDAFMAVLGSDFEPDEQHRVPGFAGYIDGYNGGVAIQPALGWCRPDFMLFSVPSSFADFGWALVDDFANVLVIEADGHDFHERTKEQARRDRSRDRAMIGRGWTPIRFTGQEIYEAPLTCADQAYTMWRTRQIDYISRLELEYRVLGNAMGVAP